MDAPLSAVFTLSRPRLWDKSGQPECDERMAGVRSRAASVSFADVRKQSHRSYVVPNRHHAQSEPCDAAEVGRIASVERELVRDGPPRLSHHMSARSSVGPIVSATLNDEAPVASSTEALGHKPLNAGTTMPE